MNSCFGPAPVASQREDRPGIEHYLGSGLAPEQEEPQREGLSDDEWLAQYRGRCREAEREEEHPKRKVKRGTRAWPLRTAAWKMGLRVESSRKKLGLRNHGGFRIREIATGLIIAGENFSLTLGALRTELRYRAMFDDPMLEKFCTARRVMRPRVPAPRV